MFLISNYRNNIAINSARDISLQYEKIISSIRSNQPDILIVAEKFANHNRNIYGVFVFLEIAKLYINESKLEQAISQLQKGLAITNDDNLKIIINLRLARIQMQERKVDEALRILNSIKEKEFAPIIANICGKKLSNDDNKKDTCNT